MGNFNDIINLQYILEKTEHTLSEKYGQYWINPETLIVKKQFKEEYANIYNYFNCSDFKMIIYKFNHSFGFQILNIVKYNNLIIFLDLIKDMYLDNLPSVFEICICESDIFKTRRLLFDNLYEMIINAKDMCKPEVDYVNTIFNCNNIIGNNIISNFLDIIMDNVTDDIVIELYNKYLYDY